MCYKALNPVFLSSCEHPRESLFFQFSSFSPGFPACNVGLQMKICQPMADTKASTPMQENNPLIPRVVFELVKKLFF